MDDEGSDRAPLVAGRDYPGSYQAFRRWFADEAACPRFLEQLR